MNFVDKRNLEMGSTLCILGRQPELGLAELESLYGATSVKRIGAQGTLIDRAPESIPHHLIGGTVKIGRVLAEVPSIQWNELVPVFSAIVREHAGQSPEGKLKLGVSVYGVKVSSSQLERAGLSLKKDLRAAGRSVRVMPNRELALSSAQVLHGQLTGPLGCELLIVADQARTYIAQTISVQDIKSYARRDFDRPKRDPRVGMLPPKLAQIMINLALPGSLSPEETVTILDPFCGTGVVLMEATLRGARVQGSDLNPTMIDFTRANLEWLGETYHVNPDIVDLQPGDARNHTWQPFTTVVSETYLGPPLTALPMGQAFDKIVRDCDQLTRDFLENLRRQTKPGQRFCIAIPAWRTTRGFRHLPLVDDLEKIGYNRVSFTHPGIRDLLYHRPDQIVARELLVLTRR